MPSGIILSSGSVGATEEAVQKVLTDNGYEPDKPEPETPPELKREDFESDEAFEQAKEAREEAKEKEPEPEAAPRLTRKQRAIDKATRKLQDDLKAANERIAALEGKKPVTPQPKIEAPKREDFQTDAQFEDAVFDYRYKMRRAKEEYENAQKALTDRLKENFENYKTQVEAFKDEHEDWDEVVNQQIPIHESVYLAIQEQENGAAVTYYLGKHPDYTRKLAEMSPLSAVMEVGRLAERLKTGAREPGTAGGGATPKPKPKLPEPVKPVSTSATSSSLTSAEAAKARDFKAFKRAQRAGR